MKNNLSTKLSGISLSLVKGINRIPHVMKISVFLFFCCTGILSAKSYAQQTLLNIVAKNASVETVLNEIERQSEFTFFYNTKQIDPNRAVSVSVEQEDIFTLLDQLFNGTGVTYKVLGKSIILSTYNHPALAGTPQQAEKIQGQVVTASGEPIIGANVVRQESGNQPVNGTITDLDGNFTLEAGKGDVIRISYIGYTDKQITIGNQTTLRIILSEDTQALDEVVVIGYGTARKSDLTGALSQVTSESFAEQNVTRIDQALQGRAPGIQISNTVGAPGGDVRIRIRGTNSVLGDNSPLFVIDGFVGADFDMLNPDDIKSMEILKDASSTAIYGSRGANGVILITTKSGGKDGKVKVNYSGNVSLSTMLKQYDVFSAGEFAETVNQHNDAMGVAKHTFTDEQVADYYRNGGFDYLDAVFRTALSHQHQLSVAGGTEKTQYRISGNFLDQEGIVKATDYKRYTVRVNFLTKINDKLSFRFNANGATSTGRNNQGRTGAGNPVVQALAWAPTTNPYDSEGGYLISDPVGSIKTNPLAMLYDTENIREKTFVNVMAGARYEILPGLSADFQAGTDLGFNHNKNWSGEYASNHRPSASKTNNKSVTVQTTTQLSYDKTFGNIHHINAVAAFETQKYTWESLSGSASNLKFAELKYDNLAQSGSVNAQSDYSMWSLLSYLGRINYTLMDRYLFSFSVRRDGSSKFADGHKYSTFPSGAIAWNAGNEPFIKDLNIFSKLKLRVSWGLTGSQAISPYATLSNYATNIYYAFATDGKTNGIQMGNPGNKDLKWETTEQKDFGIELGFFDGRLNMEFDYYIKDTRDLLLNKSVPYYQGGGSMTANVGNIRNNGIEFSIGGDIISTPEWKWDSHFNFSSVRNKVTNLGDEEQIFSHPDLAGLNGQPEFIYKVGESLGSFWGLKYLGPWQASEAEEAAKYGCVPGDARYEDLDHNNAIDGSDYQIIGCGMPKYTLGWNNTVTFKNFTLNAFFQGVFGGSKINYTRCLHMMASRDAREATLAEVRERYIPGKQENAWLPAWSPTSKWEPQSTLFMENANYLRLKNLSVAYNFRIPKLADIRVSVNATNLFTITKYKGIDPESSNLGGSGSDIQQGVDYGAYPNARTYTLGLDITF